MLMQTVHCERPERSDSEIATFALRVEFCAASCLLACWAALICLWAYPCLISLRAASLASMRWKLVTVLRRTFLLDPPPDEVDVHARKVVAQWRMERGRRWGRTLAATIPLVLVYDLADLYHIGVWGGSQPTESLARLTDQLWLELIFLGFVSVLCSMFPRLYGPRTVDYTHVVLIAISSARLFVVPNELIFKHLNNYTTLFRLVVATMFGNPLIVVTLNTIFLACELLVLNLSALDDNYRAVFTYGLVCFSSACTQSFTLAEARAKILAVMSSQGEAHVLKLLSNVCDAVVHLRPDLSIEEPCPKLDALLMHGRPCQDRPFLGLVQESDRGLCRKLFEDGCKEGPLHVRLIWQGGSVPVQLFHSTLREISGRLTHVVGILEEHDDSGRSPAVKLEAPGAAPGPEPPEAPRATAAAPSPRPLRFRPEDLMVKLDAGDPDLVILHCTSGMRQLLGPNTAGSSLLSLLDNGDAFAAWLEDLTNEHLEGCPATQARARGSFRVGLLVPGARAAQPAVCRLTFPDAVMHDVPGEPLLVYAIFQLLQRKISARSVRASSSSQSSGTARDVGEEHSGRLFSGPVVMGRTAACL